MKYITALLFALLLTSSAHALSLDLAALSSTNTRQLMVSGAHLQAYEYATGELSGKYVRSEGRDPIWEVGISTQMQTWGGFILDQDTRVFNSHSTLAGGLGRNILGITFTAGSRVEYDDDDVRTIFGRAAAVLKKKKAIKSFVFALTSKGEVLKHPDQETRFDYKVGLQCKVSKHFHIGLRFDEIRDTKTQGITLGVSF